MGSTRVTSIHNFHYREMQKFFGQMPMIKAEVEGWLNRDYSLVVMTEMTNAQTSSRNVQWFKLKAKILEPSDKIEEGTLQILPYTLQHGFELIEEKNRGVNRSWII